MSDADPAPFSRSGRCFIIAEIGTAHGGSLAKAFELIDAAKEAGADCAKFQLVYADEIIHPLTGTVKLPGGEIPLYERFRSLELPETFYADLIRYAERRGIAFLCTPFGLESARVLRSIGVKMLKIASPELNYLPLLHEVSAYGLPLILSSGVSTLGDIERAIDATGRTQTALLHCVTAYPAPESDYNLRLLRPLSALFGIPVGVSDHSKDPLLVPVLSVLSGGSIIEKHFTLSREDGGLDDPIALPPDEFARMVKAVRAAEALPEKSAMRELERRFGRDRIESVLGNGIKRLAPSERENYGRTNRSIHAVNEIPAGTVLRPELLAVLRTEKHLRPGLHPEYLPVVLGKRTSRTVPAGEGLVWEDLLST